MRKLYIAALVALTAISTAFGETRSPKKEIAANIETFAAIIKQLEANYVDSIDLNSIVKTGVGAMLSRLDPYTEYFDQKEQEEFMNSNQGEYAGIGSYIT
ncbi:MAG: peptidase S41, partial [Paramuribaculum sp.]|nr:peptidase S41 [Paramuribaculum sp.]